MDEDTELQEFTLSDLDVMTVGLVERGAVSLDDTGGGKNFFLLKSEANSMADDLKIEMVEKDDSDSSLFAKFEAWLKEVIAKAKAKKMDTKAVAQAAQVLQGGGYDVQPSDLAEMLADYAEEEMEEDEVEMEDKKAMTKTNDENVEKAAVETSQPVAEIVTTAALEAVQKAHLDAIEKAHQAKIEALEKAMAEKYETQLTALSERVEKAEQERLAAIEKRERREYLEKAMTYRALPGTSYTDLGDMLYTLAKSVEQTEFEKWAALLKAVDAQLGAAGIFAEMGTARTPEQATLEDKIAKANQELKDPAAALLALSETEQYELLKSMRGGK